MMHSMRGAEHKPLKSNAVLNLLGVLTYIALTYFYVKTY